MDMFSYQLPEPIMQTFLGVAIEKTVNDWRKCSCSYYPSSKQRKPATRSAENKTRVSLVCLRGETLPPTIVVIH